MICDISLFHFKLKERHDGILEVTWTFIFLKITYSEVPHQALAEICLMNRKKKGGEIIEDISI